MQEYKKQLKESERRRQSALTSPSSSVDTASPSAADIGRRNNSTGSSSPAPRRFFRCDDMETKQGRNTSGSALFTPYFFAIFSLDTFSFSYQPVCIFEGKGSKAGDRKRKRRDAKLVTRKDATKEEMASRLHRGKGSGTHRPRGGGQVYCLSFPLYALLFPFLTLLPPPQCVPMPPRLSSFGRGRRQVVAPTPAPEIQ